MIFEQIATGGCQSYLLGCGDTCAGALIDPEVSQVDRYLALAARDALRIRFVIDTHPHAGHFSAARQVADRLGAAIKALAAAARTRVVASLARMARAPA